MQRDTGRGTALILFGIAIMVFGATSGATVFSGITGVVGLVTAVTGLFDALSAPRS